MPQLEMIHIALFRSQANVE